MSCVHVAIDLRILDRKGMERSGIGRHALETAKALRAARPDWRLTIESNRRDLGITGPGTELRATRWPTASSIGRASWIEAGSIRARPNEADVWLAPSFFLSRYRRGPSVVMVHDLVFEEHPALYRGRLNSRYATQATRAAIRRADLVLCATTALRERLEAEDRRVEVIPWGGVGDVFRAGEAAGTSSTPDPYWLFVGRWEERKGIDVLAAARRLIAAGDTPSRLVLAGEPGAGVDAAISALRTDPDVSVEPRVTDERLAQLYRGALGLVYPSRLEGFGLPIAEAMACGCPVIASDLPELREWVGDGAVWAVPDDPSSLAAAMTALAGDPALRGRLGERGRQLADSLRWERVGGAVAQAIEKVLGRSSS